MKPDQARQFDRHLIIGGTIKAATSSVFAYLSGHPEICGSKVKETFFFTGEYTGNRDNDYRRYSTYFSACKDDAITLEASPNYLAYKENVAERIMRLLPHARLLFILRNPVDRLYSHYHFAKSKLQITDNISFDRFVDLCEQYNSNKTAPEKAGIIETHLRALEIGSYSKYLLRYFEVFPEENIKIMLFDDLKKDPVSFMRELCLFINIDPDFYRHYRFNRVNVTFSGRIRIIHMFALVLNRILEVLLRHRPGIKRGLVKIYKKLNQNHEGYIAMSDATRQRLEEYYAPGNADLKAILSDRELPGWLK